MGCGLRKKTHKSVKTRTRTRALPHTLTGHTGILRLKMSMRASIFVNTDKERVVRPQHRRATMKDRNEQHTQCRNA